VPYADKRIRIFKRRMKFGELEDMDSEQELQGIDEDDDLKGVED
jgi:hypothetical protein